MKKVITLIALASMVTVMVFSQGVAATQQNISYGASWNYGRNAGIYAYSNVTSSSRQHSSTVTCGSSSSMSGTVEAGVTSYANIWVAPWDHPSYYYNIW